MIQAGVIPGRRWRSHRRERESIARAWDWIPFPVLRTAGDDTGAIPLSRVGEGQG